MRPSILYGSTFIFCLIVSFTTADKKWKYNEENPYQKIKPREGNSKNKLSNDDVAQIGLKSGKTYQKAKESGRKNAIGTDSSEEETFGKEKKPGGDGQAHKKIIGRIEHGKVKVLRRKEDSQQNNEIDSEEDPKEKVCKKSKRDCMKNTDDDSSDNSSEEEKPKGKPQKKIKYSIKFQHEKQKKKDDNGNMRIMRLHKNGKKDYGKDDNDSSEEDDKPIKRFHYVDDDE